MPYPSRRAVRRRNEKNYADAKTAQVAKTWEVSGGTCQLRQRKSGKWTAEFLSHDEEEFAVAIAKTPAQAIKRLSRDIPAALVI